MKRVLSCIQPTGDLHLGNYFGAIQNWVRLQDTYECVYGVVDCHSMTMPYHAPTLRDNTWKMVFQLLATGIKPENLFVQSLIPEHIELYWILGSVTSYGELQKMTQFKDKKTQLEEKDNQAFISSGLFMYPVLQAADILVYRADYVPIGKDQEQHLELSRDIVARFNYQFKQPYFEQPQPLFTEITKLLSPADPTKKMSKSLGEKHYINLFSTPDAIRKQVKKAVTDTGDQPEGVMSAGVANLFNLLKACDNMDAYTTFMAHYEANTLRYGDLKGEVAETLVRLTTPFTERLAELEGNAAAVKAEIFESSAKIRQIAQQTLRDVKDIVGLLNAY